MERVRWDLARATTEKKWGSVHTEWWEGKPDGNEMGIGVKTA